MAKSGISLREFARREGVSDTLVRKAIKQGKLKKNQDGNLSETLLGSGWRGEKHTVRTPSANPGSQSGADKASQKAKEEPPESTGNVLSLADAQTRKEIQLAKLRELEYQTKVGDLVDAREVERTIAELSGRERDAWLAWPQSVAGAMALELNVDHKSLARILDKHVREHLAERSKRGPSEASA